MKEFAQEFRAFMEFIVSDQPQDEKDFVAKVKFSYDGQLLMGFFGGYHSRDTKIDELLSKITYYEDVLESIIGYSDIKDARDHAKEALEDV